MQFAQALWRSRLIRYFQNARARRDNSLQIVLAHKQKTKMTVSAGGEKSTSLYGLANYLPARPSGETDETIAAMKKMMADEIRKQHPDRNYVTEMMNQTFADRRHMIVKDIADVGHIKATYPCLFDKDEVQFIVIHSYLLNCTKCRTSCCTRLLCLMYAGLLIALAHSLGCCMAMLSVTTIRNPCEISGRFSNKKLSYCRDSTHRLGHFRSCGSQVWQTDGQTDIRNCDGNSSIVKCTLKSRAGLRYLGGPRLDIITGPHGPRASHCLSTSNGVQV